MNTELLSITAEIHKTVQRMDKASKEIFRLAKNKAETERAYRIELGKTMVRMRDEKVPVTIIEDLAKAEIAELKFERDLAAELYRSGLSVIEVLKSEVNALQSIARYQSEIGG